MSCGKEHLPPPWSIERIGRATAVMTVEKEENDGNATEIGKRGGLLKLKFPIKEVIEMKKDWTRWTASMLCGFALISFLGGCESKENDTPAQAPGEGQQSLAPQDPELGAGMTPTAPEEEGGQAEKETQQKPMGSG